jgi:hypothetical protein
MFRDEMGLQVSAPLQRTPQLLDEHIVHPATAAINMDGGALWQFTP